MTTSDRRGDPSVPPSFTPGASRPRPASGDGQPVVVGRQPTRPTPPPPRVSARAGGSARPVPPAGSVPPAPRAVPPRSAEPRSVPPRSVPPQSRPAAQPRSARSTGQGGATVAPPRRPAGPAAPATPTAPAGARHRRRRAVVTVLVLLVVLAIAWPVGLAVWANGRLQHVDALSGAAATPGTTYLLAGSDERSAADADGTEGARADTIMVLHVPASGPAALISIPRDSYVDIPGFGSNKINAAWTDGGAPLLVRTVEQLTGMTVDHYVEVGFGGVTEIVDALGGVELCSDLDIPTPAKSGLVWTPGCHLTDGTVALQFARERYADPKGDIGRAERQRQVIQKVAAAAGSRSTLVDPGRQVRLVSAGTNALSVDDDANVLTLGRLALAFRAATGPGGVTGTPPIKSLDYRPGGVGSTVLLDPDQTPAFFARIANGEEPPGVVGGITG